MLGIQLNQGGKAWQLFRAASAKENFVSASEAATLCNFDPSKPASTYLLNKGKNIKTEAMQWGITHEPLAISEARKLLDPENKFRWIKPGMVVNHPMAISCSPDAMFHQRVTPEELVKDLLLGREEYPEDFLQGLEVKCPFSKPVPTTADAINPCHVLQCIWGMFVCDIKIWYLYYWTENHGKALFQIKRPDRALFEREFLTRAKSSLCQDWDRKKNRCSAFEMDQRKMLKDKWKNHIVPKLFIEKIKI